MKLSKLLESLGPDEHAFSGNLVFVYQRKGNGLDTLKQVLQVEDDLSVISRPPSGMRKITNIYWDPNIKKVAVEYDTEA